MVNARIDAAQGAVEGHIFERRDGRPPARPAVGRGRHGNAGPKVLIVARPGVGRVRVEPGFVLCDERVVGGIAPLVQLGAGFQRGAFGGIDPDAPPTASAPRAISRSVAANQGSSMNNLSTFRAKSRVNGAQS